jgi:hypothetical protein
MDPARPLKSTVGGRNEVEAALETAMSADRANPQKRMFRDEISDKVRRQGVKQTDS